MVDQLTTNGMAGFSSILHNLSLVQSAKRYLDPTSGWHARNLAFTIDVPLISLTPKWLTAPRFRQQRQPSPPIDAGGGQDCSLAARWSYYARPGSAIKVHFCSTAMLSLTVFAAATRIALDGRPALY